MKRTLFSLLTLLCMLSAATAQAATALKLGYCNGRVASSGSIGSSTKNIWTSGAIHVKQSDLKPYLNCHIDSICAGITAKLNVDSIVVWLRTSLDGDNLAEGCMSKADVKKGWNQVGLKQSFTIGDNLSDGLYIGYSYHQKGSSYALSAVAPGVEGGLYVKVGDEAWQDLSSEGVLSVEALVYGDNLPRLNLALESVSMPSVFVCSKGTFAVETTVRNKGTQTVTGFDLTTAFSSLGETYTTHIDTSLAYNDAVTLTLNMRPAITSDEPEKRLTTLTLSNINEGDDENMADNVFSDSVNIARYEFERSVLLEEFTTEKCSKCPRMAGVISDVISSGKYDGRLNVLCHHTGYYSDWLTTACDSAYLWFYNADGYIYAPALMFDRVPFGTTTPVVGQKSQEEVEAYLDYCMAQPAYVTLNIAAERDDTDNHRLNVRVSGERTKKDLTEGETRLVVALVENNIAARSQAGSDGGFTHQHVKRAVNKAWGEPLQWNGKTYDYACSFVLNDSWKLDNMQVVAYIFGLDYDDPTNCGVANSASISMPASVTGMEPVEAESAAKAEKAFYNLSGQRVPEWELRPGLYVVKQGGKTQKQVVR